MGCIYDDQNSAVVGNLMGISKTGTNDVFFLDTAYNATSDCNFTTKKIPSDELHEVDKEFVELEKMEKDYFWKWKA